MDRRLMDQAAEEAWDLAQIKLEQRKADRQLEKYRDDPVAFAEEIYDDFLTEDMKETMISVRDNPVTIAKSGNSVGKSQPIYTRIPTPDGLKRLGDISVGDQVFGYDGKPQKVIGVFPQGMQPTYEVKFTDGIRSYCSEDHLWATLSSSQKYKGGEWEIRTTKEVKEVLHRFISIPVAKPVLYDEKDFYIHPYVMGIILGDGGLTGGSCVINNLDKEIVSLLESRLPEELTLQQYSRGRFSITHKPGHRNPIIAKLREFRLMGKKSTQKTIPPKYLMGSIEQRKELLRGLLDSDGYIAKNGRIEYCTSSRWLSHDVVDLVNSLGGTARIRRKETKYKYKGEMRKGKDAYTVTINVSFMPVHFSRKKERVSDREKRTERIRRVIDDITPVGKMESVCISVENEDGLYLTENYVVTHNTYSAAKIALWFFSVYKGSKVFLTAAPPLDNLKRLLWGEIVAAINKKEGMFDGYKKRSLYLERNKKSFIQCLTIPQTGTASEREAKFSGKHSSHMLFIVDEGDAVPDEIYSGIESCMSGGHARLLIMFNPRHKSGSVYQKEKNRQANVVQISAIDHPNVITGKNLIPGAVDRQTVVKRINEWTRPLKADEDPEKTDTFEIPDFLVGATAVADDGTVYEPLPAGIRKIEEAAFSYMVLGQYPAQSESQLISEEWILEAQQRWKLYVAEHGEKQTGKPKYGLDISEMGTDENQSCFRYANFVERFDNYWSGIDTDATATRALRLCREKNVDVLYVDGTSWGSSVAPSVARQARDKGLDIRAVGVKIANAPEDFLKVEMGEFYQLRDQLYWAIRKWLKEEQAMLPPDPYLAEELLALEYTVTNAGKIKVIDKDKLRKLLKRSPNKADALALTFAPYERATVLTLGN